MPASRLLLVLKRSAQQEAMLSTYLQSLQDSTSPNYGKWLTPEEFGARFGVSDADLATVQTWLQEQGFAIDKVSRSRMAIEFSGTVGQVQTAFATSIHSYGVNGELHWANATDPQIPAALAPVVAGLAELNDFVPRSQAIKGPLGTYNPDTNRIEPEYTLGNTTSGYYIYVSPADAATIYDSPTSLNPAYSGTKYDGTGVTIGIAGDSNIDVSQNANYRAAFGLPANPTTVVVDGLDPGENGDAIEAYLDTQVSGGVAPGAKVILYTAQNSYLNAGLYLAIIRALDDNQADILNVSFGACEGALGTSGNQFIYNMMEQAAAQGISVTVSTGDSGSAGCDNPNTETAAQYGLAVNGLASTPFNIAVGGTDFDVLYSSFPTSFTQYVDVTNTLANHRSALKYIPEEPWNDSTYPNTSILQNVPLSVASHYQSNDDIVAGGGGVSSCATGSTGACGGGYALPAWQTGFGVDATGRNLPDVSFLAGNGLYGALWGLCTDLEVYASTGQPAPNCVPPTTGNNFIVTGVGGTSAAAPAFAGMLALVEQKVGSRLGQADYVLYKLAKTKYASVFHDAVTGNNSVECAFGSPNCEAVNLVNTNYLSGYNAATGYDEATGLGSVDANQMLSSWSSAGLTATNSSLTLNGGTAALNLTHGAAVTVQANVTGSGGTPSGDVALVDSIDPATLPNNDSIGSFSLAGGTATGITNSLPGGSYNVSAHYGGSNTFAESDSNSIAVTISPESSSINLKVAGYFDPFTGKALNAPYYGSIYLLDAQPYGNSASASNPNGAATGTITFKNGTTTLGTAPLASDGIAELQISTLPGGSNILSASFPGDASFNASTSAPLTFTVVPAATTLSAISSIYQYNSMSAGIPIPMNVNLTVDSAGVAPTGTVAIVEGSNTLGTAPITGLGGTSSVPASGTASISIATLPTGTHTLKASYSGDSNYASSQSASSTTFTINPMPLSMLMIPPNTLTPTNQPVPIAISFVAVVSNSLPPPTGTVTLTYNGTTTPPVTLVNGIATVTIPANTLPVGTTTVTGNYSGDQYYASATTTNYANMKGSGSITPNINISAPTGVVNYPITVAVAISGTSGSPAATGKVSLTGGNYLSSAALSNGAASFLIQSSLYYGQNTLTATYLGDNNFTNGTGTGTVTLVSVAGVNFTNYAPTVVVNQPLTISVNLVGPAGVIAPTGTLTLSSGSYTSGPTPVAASAATFTIPANTLPVGNDTLTATYSGDVNYGSSTGSEPVTVNAVPVPDLTVVGTNVSVSAGATTGNNSSITITPSGGFTGAVTLTASITAGPAGAHDPPTLSFGATSPVNITGTSAGTATMTVSTTGNTSTCSSGLGSGSKFPWLPGGTIALAVVLMVGFPAKRRSWQTMLGLMSLLIVLAGGVTACGGGGGGSKACTVTSVQGTTPGTYTATITATAGTITKTTTLTVTVN